MCSVTLDKKAGGCELALSESSLYLANLTRRLSICGLRQQMMLQFFGRKLRGSFWEVYLLRPCDHMTWDGGVDDGKCILQHRCPVWTPEVHTTDWLYNMCVSEWLQGRTLEK